MRKVNTQILLCISNANAVQGRLDLFDTKYLVIYDIYYTLRVLYYYFMLT